MNSKLVKASLAGAAAIALAAGGGTFAAWSDFQTVTGNETDAGHLVLNLPGTSGPITNVGINSIAPGQARTIDYFLTSADLDGVPSANLTMKVKDLADQENGCASNSEAVAEGASVAEAQSGDYSNAACNAVADAGEFSSQAYMRVRYSDPATAAGAWDPSHHECTLPVTHSAGYAPASNNDTTIYPRLASFTTAAPLGTLTAGQGVCVRIDIGLDPNASNATQGDGSTFNLQFDLAQV